VRDHHRGAAQYGDLRRVFDDGWTFGGGGAERGERVAGGEDHVDVRHPRGGFEERSRNRRSRCGMSHVCVPMAM